MASKAYRLQQGTKLSDRYRIIKVIGEGGFGITYEAINEKMDLKVAIKELYCKEFVKRDVGQSNLISLSYADFQQDFDKAKERFLKEARVLCKFSQESGIVHIIDFFEENNTAYIVMNYVEGETLSNYLKKNGSVPWDVLIDMIRPIVKALDKIHNSGIIHRDISSNNIMVGKDGSLCLLDFGASKEYIKNSEQTASFVVTKNGYTPIEQYSNSNIGCWTDIYALMAVCYECITGELPPISLQRAVYDEYKPIKKMGIAVPKQLELIFQKGLAINAEDRYQSTAELLADLDELVLYEKEKYKRIRKKIIKVCVSLLIFLCVVGGFCFYRFRNEIYFHWKPTEAFYLIGNDGKPTKEHSETVNELKKRVGLLAGGEPYIFREEDSAIYCELPLECFREFSPIEIIDRYVSNVGSFYIAEGLNYEIEPVNISDVFYAENDRQIIVKFSDTLPEDVRNVLSQSPSIEIDMDVISDAMSGDYMELVAEKRDEYVYQILLNDQLIYSNLRELFINNLKKGNLMTDFRSNPQILVEWETVNGIETPLDLEGKNQCNVENLKSEKIVLEYEAISDNISDGEYLDAKNHIKNRLDSMEIPYAFGVDKNYRHNYVICVEQEDYNKDLFRLLLADDIGICDAWGRTIAYVDSTSKTALKKDVDGNYVFIVELEELEDEDDSEISGVTGCTALMAEQGIETYYIEIKGLRILGGKLKSISGKLQPVTDGTLVFDSIKMDSGKITEDNVVVLNLIENMIHNKEFYSSYQLKTYQYFDNKNVIRPYPQYERLTAQMNTEDEDSIVKKIKEISDEIAVAWGMEEGLGEVLDVGLPEESYLKSSGNEDVVIGMVKEILGICCVAESTPWRYISIGVNDGDAWVSKIGLHRNIIGECEGPYEFSFIAYEKEEVERMNSIYNYFKNDKDYNGYYMEFNDYSKDE